MGRGPLEWLRRDSGLPIPDLIIQLDASPDQLADRPYYGLKEGETRRFQIAARNAFSYMRNVLENDWVLVSALLDQETLSDLVLHFTMVYLENVVN